MPRIIILAIAATMISVGAAAGQTKPAAPDDQAARMAKVKEIRSFAYRAQSLDQTFELIGSVLRLTPLQFGEARRAAGEWYASAACSKAGEVEFSALLLLESFGQTLKITTPQGQAVSHFIAQMAIMDLGRPSAGAFSCKYAARLLGKS